MASPRRSSVTIDGKRFNAIAAQLSTQTVHDGTGMPLMGSLSCTIEVTVDMHDTTNMPFATLSALYDLANLPTRDKIKNMEISYWADDLQQDAICVFRFRGWISSFTAASGDGSNHTLHLSLQPALDKAQFVKIDLSN